MNKIEVMQNCTMLVPISKEMLFPLTCDTGEQLSCKVLYLCAWKWDKSIALQEVEDTGPEQIRDYTDVVSKVESISQMNTLVSIGFVVQS